ncbi:hypothetical protein [Providencia sp. Me31A]|uniref:hypothetical protein n=1 Tax=Providencia sp. Me31A TaxID=3392637 RepID=UPI003D2CDBF0
MEFSGSNRALSYQKIVLQRRYPNYKGDTIIHHHVDFVQYAIPVPSSTHVGSGGIWHTK